MDIRPACGAAGDARPSRRGARVRAPGHGSLGRAKDRRLCTARDFRRGGGVARRGGEGARPRAAGSQRGNARGDADGRRFQPADADDAAAPGRTALGVRGGRGGKTRTLLSAGGRLSLVLYKSVSPMIVCGAPQIARETRMPAIVVDSMAEMLIAVS